MSVQVSAIFAYRDRVLTAIEALREAGFRTLELFTPVPDEHLLEAVGHRRTRVGYFTLAGGLFGLALGFGGASWTHLLWGLIVGGKPVVSVPPFVIVGFEMTILFGGLATLAGVLLLSGLPRWKQDAHFDPRVTEDHYALVVEVEAGEADRARAILREAGGEVRP